MFKCHSQVFSHLGRSYFTSMLLLFKLIVHTFHKFLLSYLFTFCLLICIKLCFLFIYSYPYIFCFLNQNTCQILYLVFFFLSYYDNSVCKSQISFIFAFNPSQIAMLNNVCDTSFPRRNSSVYFKAIGHFFTLHLESRVFSLLIINLALINLL